MSFKNLQRSYHCFYRPQGLTEQQLSLHCSESGLVDTLQTLTSLLPEALGKVEVVPLAQVKNIMIFVVLKTTNGVKILEVMIIITSLRFQVAR